MGRFERRPPDPDRVTGGRDVTLLADEDLMPLVRAGDTAAFEVVYERHCGAAFSLAYRMTGRRGSAEDVVQDAFLSLWRAGARYDHTRGSVRTWVLAVVHHRAIDVLRRGLKHDARRASDEGIEERFEAAERTDVQAVRREEAAEVRSALAALPADQSRAIELAYFGGFSHSEIATMLETPIGTVKGRIRLGLDKLRGELGHFGELPA